MKERPRFDVQNMTKDEKRSAAFPSETGEVSVSKTASKHLPEFWVCDQWSGFPPWWPHHVTRMSWPLSDLRGLLMSPAGYGTSWKWEDWISSSGSTEFFVRWRVIYLQGRDFSGSQKFDTWKQDWQIHPLTELARTRMGRDAQLPPP